MPEINDNLHYLWLYFIEIINGCRENKITYSDLQAWSEMTQTKLNLLEVKIIKMFEAVLNDANRRN